MLKYSLVCLGALALASAQNGYSRDRPTNQLGYNNDQNQFEHGFSGEDEVNGDEIPGVAGEDYPVYSEVPRTDFHCGKQQYPGYYADPEAQCQAYYICQGSGRGAAFLCPVGTVFNQKVLACDWWYNVDCSRAEELYSVNEEVSRAMDEADARLAQQSQQQNGGYNYDSPGSGGQHTSAISTMYGAPQQFGGSGSRNGFGSNGNGHQQNGDSHQQNGLGRQQNGHGQQQNEFRHQQSGFGQQNGHGHQQNGHQQNGQGQQQNGIHRGNGQRNNFNGNSQSHGTNRPSPSSQYGPPSFNGGHNGNGNNGFQHGGSNGNNGHGAQAPNRSYLPPNF